MRKLDGKTLIFTDLHCGLAGNKLSRLNICVQVVKEIVSAIKNEGITNVVFGGDWYHSRSTLDVNTINVSLKLVQAIAKHANLYLICGNHDSFFKNSTDVNSLNMFRDTPNVVVIDKPEEFAVNSQRCLFVPWLTDLSSYEAESFDMMIGHFEISSKYLIQSYIEDNIAKQRASRQTSDAIESDQLLQQQGESKSSSLIGNFVDLVKRGGTIYAGHIHRHKEFLVRGRKFFFVGSPYQQTLGEIDSPCGYYILDRSNRPEFQAINSTPHHVKVTMSDVVAGKFDFKCVANAIIQKIYDIDVDAKTEAETNQRINDFKPYEELLPDYQVAVGSYDEKNRDNSSLELIRKSKIEYMRNYVENIDSAALGAQDLNRDKLFDVLESYYKRVTEG